MVLPPSSCKLSLVPFVSNRYTGSNSCKYMLFSCVWFMSSFTVLFSQKWVIIWYLSFTQFVNYELCNFVVVILVLACFDDASWFGYWNSISLLRSHLRDYIRYVCYFLLGSKARVKARVIYTKEILILWNCCNFVKHL